MYTIVMREKPRFPRIEEGTFFVVSILIHFKVDNTHMDKVKIHRIKWSLVGILLLTLVALLFIFRQPLYNQLFAWDLIPKPETYTELYFDSTPAKQYLPGKPYHIAFTLHNAEQQTTSYTYTVDQQNISGSSVATLAKGTVLLSQDAKKTLSIPVTLSDFPSTNTVQVTISFLEKNKSEATIESIHLLVKKEGI